MRDKIVGYAMCLLAAGCTGIELTSYQMENSSMHYSQPLTMNRNRVTVTVFWREDVSQSCPTGAMACAMSVDNECFVYAQKPRSWNDSVRLRTFGHELSHCLSAEHE
jgi:hypothetical protein